MLFNLAVSTGSCPPTCFLGLLDLHLVARSSMFMFTFAGKFRSKLPSQNPSSSIAKTMGVVSRPEAPISPAAYAVAGAAGAVLANAIVYPLDL